jgi:hypothetical protein
MASGLGMHLASMDKLIDEYEPEVVIIDLISNLINTSDALDARSILTQLIDYLKTKRITTVCIRLLGHDNLESQGRPDPGHPYHDGDPSHSKEDYRGPIEYRARFSGPGPAPGEVVLNERY